MEFEFLKNPTVDSIDKVPEQFRGLYSEGEGGYVLNEGFKGTAGAIDGLNKSLKAARRDADEAKRNRPDVSGFAAVGQLLGLAGGDAFRRFFVKQAGFRCRAAFFREAAHSHLPVGVAIENIEPVADLQFTRRLAGGAVEPDLAAADRIGGEAARLEEARRPQPLVDADASHSGSTDSPA